MPVDEGDHVEVGLVGDEGMFGVSLALGVNTSPVRAVVQGAGVALRMDAERFCLEVAGAPALRHEIHRYVHVYLTQLSQSAGCTRFHVVEERLARWLLMTHDRVKSDRFRLTHEFLGAHAGRAAGGRHQGGETLQERKLISYSRGDITVLDRRGAGGSRLRLLRGGSTNVRPVPRLAAAGTSVGRTLTCGGVLLGRCSAAHASPAASRPHPKENEE